LGVRVRVRVRAEAKAPPYSASATKEQTTGMRVEWEETGWLRNRSMKSWSDLLPRKWKFPATLRALGLDKYEASDKMRSTMSDAR
jgi:hypothetical protein